MKQEQSVGIVDYGCGNIKSVLNALHSIGSEGQLIVTPAELERSRTVLLPGVGSFDHAMKNLEATGFSGALGTWIKNPDNRLLGICLGMQLLCTQSEESDQSLAGLHFVDAAVSYLGAHAGEEVKTPHMGWNSIQLSAAGREHPLMRELSDETDFYFLHSYGVFPASDDSVLAWSQHGNVRFASAIWNGRNVFGTQFHPEKSQHAGLKLLENFVHHA